MINTFLLVTRLYHLHIYISYTFIWFAHLYQLHVYISYTFIQCTRLYHLHVYNQHNNNKLFGHLHVYIIYIDILVTCLELLVLFCLLYSYFDHCINHSDERSKSKY